jgi:hypothetical protein
MSAAFNTTLKEFKKAQRQSGLYDVDIQLQGAEST